MPLRAFEKGKRPVGRPKGSPNLIHQLMEMQLEAAAQLGFMKWVLATDGLSDEKIQLLLEDLRK